MKQFDSKQVVTQEIQYPQLFGKCLGNPIEKDPHTKLIRLHQKQGPINEPNGPEIIGFMKKYLPLEGQLEMDEKGFIYLDISDEILFQLQPLIGRKEAKLPPYFGPERSYGAHISVVLPHENPFKMRPSQIGEEFSFIPTGCFYIEPTNWPEMRYVWFITVEAPALKEIRSQLHLPPYIKNQEFHITLGVEPRFLSLEQILEASSEMGGSLKIKR